MNIWIVVWAFFATFIMGITFWSFRILIRQKQAWGQYAKRHNLDYDSKAFIKSPIVSGMVGDYFITILSVEQDDDDGKGRCYRSVIQFNLKNPMMVEGVIASSWLRRFAGALKLPQEGTNAMKEISHGTVVFSQDDAKLTPYFTMERVQVLAAMAAVKNAAILMIFNEEEAFLRFETSDALDDVSRLEKLVNKVIDAAKVLEAK